MLPRLCLGSHGLAARKGKRGLLIAIGGLKSSGLS